MTGAPGHLIFEKIRSLIFAPHCRVTIPALISPAKRATSDILNRWSDGRSQVEEPVYIGGMICLPTSCR
jgi:hypothetical protein